MKGGGDFTVKSLTRCHSDWLMIPQHYVTSIPASLIFSRQRNENLPDNTVSARYFKPMPIVLLSTHVWKTVLHLFFNLKHKPPSSLPLTWYYDKRLKSIRHSISTSLKMWKHMNTNPPSFEVYVLCKREHVLGHNYQSSLEKGYWPWQETKSGEEEGRGQWRPSESLLLPGRSEKGERITKLYKTRKERRKRRENIKLFLKSFVGC